VRSDKSSDFTLQIRMPGDHGVKCQGLRMHRYCKKCLRVDVNTLHTHISPGFCVSNAHRCFV
jgi:hypothetical protein